MLREVEHTYLKNILRKPAEPVFDAAKPHIYNNNEININMDILPIMPTLASKSWIPGIQNITEQTMGHFVVYLTILHVFHALTAPITSCMYMAQSVGIDDITEIIILI